jgi:NUMOD3 motif
MTTYCLYLYLREDNSPYYVGKGTKTRAYSTYNRSVATPKDLSKIKIYDGLTEEVAIVAEIYTIHLFGRKDNKSGILRNLTDGGEGLSGRVVSDATKEKMRNAKLGTTQSPEHVNKLRLANLGRTQSAETKNKISIALRGKKKPERSKEHRTNLSIAKTGCIPWNKGIKGRTKCQ